MVQIDIKYLGDLRTEATHEPSGVTALTDAPKDNQGLGRSFSPTDLLATALGSCMLTIMGIVARREGVELHGASVRVVKQMTTSGPRRVARLGCAFHLPAHLTPAQRLKLQNAAVTCPVHQSLHPELSVEVEYHYDLT